MANAKRSAKPVRHRKSRIEIWKAKGKFYFHLRAPNGKITLSTGRGYPRRNDMVKTLNSIAEIFKSGRIVIDDQASA
jgi:uncharacterized protein YegP (UPF0339 family)